MTKSMDLPPAHSGVDPARSSKSGAVRERRRLGSYSARDDQRRSARASMPVGMAVDGGGEPLAGGGGWRWHAFFLFR